MADYTPTPEETSKEKIRLIKLVKSELKEHGLVDLTDFINKNSTKGFINNHGFARSVAYKLEEIGEAEVIVRKEWTEFYVKRNIYSKRYPYRFAGILGLVGLFFSIVIGLSNHILSERLKSRETQTQMQLLQQKQQEIFDSLTNLRHNLKSVQDSLANILKFK